MLVDKKNKKHWLVFTKTILLLLLSISVMYFLTKYYGDINAFTPTNLNKYTVIAVAAAGLHLLYRESRLNWFIPLGFFTGWGLAPVVYVYEVMTNKDSHVTILETLYGGAQLGAVCALCAAIAVVMFELKTER